MGNMNFYGLDAEENRSNRGQRRGYDLYESTFGEVMGAVASDTWARNPLQSLVDLSELNAARTQDKRAEVERIGRDDLNKEYSNLGLFFEEDEYQSVVDIMVREKEKELERLDIINRGEGGFLQGAASFGVGLGVSIFDPVNLAASFVPVYGQMRYLKQLSRAKDSKYFSAMSKTRLKKGLTEGAVGAALVEPIVLASANQLQAEYGLVDSFMNISFGSIMGGGLHVGAGKVRDIATTSTQKRKIIKGRKELGMKEELGDPDINLYAEYFKESTPTELKAGKKPTPMDKLKTEDPETYNLILEKKRLFNGLQETSPKTQDALLKKSLNDILQDKPVDVTPIVNADPVLKEVSDNKNPPTNPNVPDPKPITEPQKALSIDDELIEFQGRLDTLRQEGRDREFDADAEEIDFLTKQLDEINTKPKEVKEAIVDAINCMNGK